jgi:N-methylhydantoinase A/oxoprolinase/acetone carboxylase beta subunit
MFLNSWANPEHEMRAAEMVKRVAREKGVELRSSYPTG